MTHEVIIPVETRSSIIGKFWLTHYYTNNQINICVLSNPKQNDIGASCFISILKIKDIKIRRDRNKDHKFFLENPLLKKQNNITENLKIKKTKSHKAQQIFILKKLYGPFLWMGFNCQLPQG